MLQRKMFGRYLSQLKTSMLMDWIMLISILVKCVSNFFGGLVKLLTTGHNKRKIRKIIQKIISIPTSLFDKTMV
jgi:hypothetical protein